MMKNPHVQRLPDAISGLEELEDLLSEPTPGVVRSMGDLEGDIIILGAGGKIGPSLARGYPRVSAKKLLAWTAH